MDECVIYCSISLDNWYLEILERNKMSNAWSDSLIDETRSVLDLDFAPFGDFVHMKNLNGSCGQITLKDLLERKLIIQDKETTAKYIYGTADELIVAGWAVD